MQVIIEERRGRVEAYEYASRLGRRIVVHGGCPIKWEVAPMAEVVSRDPPRIKITPMPRIPGEYQ